MKEITMEEYQTRALDTAVYPDRGNNPVYPVLGLNGEAGEIAEKMKKIIRDHSGDLEGQRDNLKAELGDVLWYVAVCAHEFGFELSEVAEFNLDKLADRKKRGVLGGEGDRR